MKESGSGKHAELLKPDYSAGLFAGTARYYAAYRVPYPEALLEDLGKKARVTGKGRLLDLACGPGRVALPLSRHFSEVLAVDQESEMIDVGKEEAKKLGVKNVQWKVGRAEDLNLLGNSIELITIGEAFHRLDQRLILELAQEWLLPGGCLATLGCDGIRRGLEPWQDVLRSVLRTWTGKESKPRTSGLDTTRTAEHAMQVCEGAGFVDVQSQTLWHNHVWSLLAIIGNLYSASGNLKETLGSKAKEFETDLERQLLAHDSSGRYSERIGFGYTLGRKSG